jgi:hypothetical protein
MPSHKSESAQPIPALLRRAKPEDALRDGQKFIGVNYRSPRCEAKPRFPASAGSSSNFTPLAALRNTFALTLRVWAGLHPQSNSPHAALFGLKSLSTNALVAGRVVIGIFGTFKGAIIAVGGHDV